MRIKTIYDPAPIGDRRFDWAAYDDETYTGEPNQPVGLGETEQQAIDALYAAALLLRSYAVDEAATLMIEKYNAGLPN